MRTVFLAGGTASGKSTVAKELEALGALRIDLDGLSREVLAPGEPCLNSVVEVFGEDLLQKDGTLNRALLAERIFVDEKTASQLEQIELPYIKDLLVKRLEEAKLSGVDVAVIEIPLLDRMEDFLDAADFIVVVTLPFELRLERALGRGMNKQDFLDRISKQPTDDYLRRHATHEIVNDGSLEQLKEQVATLWKQLLS